METQSERQEETADEAAKKGGDFLAKQVAPLLAGALVPAIVSGVAVSLANSIARKVVTLLLETVVPLLEEALSTSLALLTAEGLGAMTLGLPIAMLAGLGVKTYMSYVLAKKPNWLRKMEWYVSDVMTAFVSCSVQTATTDVLGGTQKECETKEEQAEGEDAEQEKKSVEQIELTAALAALGFTREAGGVGVEIKFKDALEDIAKMTKDVKNKLESHDAPEVGGTSGSDKNSASLDVGIITSQAECESIRERIMGDEAAKPMLITGGLDKLKYYVSLAAEMARKRLFEDNYVEPLRDPRIIMRPCDKIFEKTSNADKTHPRAILPVWIMGEEYYIYREITLPSYDVYNDGDDHSKKKMKDDEFYKAVERAVFRRSVRTCPQGYDFLTSASSGTDIAVAGKEKAEDGGTTAKMEVKQDPVADH
eukprot:g17131.t1